MATYQEYLDGIESMATARGWIRPDSSPAERAAAVEELLSEGDNNVVAMATTLLHQLGGGDRYPAAA
ncbi:hypothetical protein [Kitasatospora sp. NPDC047058]|uniref:hypothetical protein n=1 Tax=Kitasatospora sp. NPDC047058 TaxID=3155620 RepID=UPI0033BFC898